MKLTNRLWFFLIVCVVIFTVPIACAPNAGKDGADGSGADGAAGIPGADGSGSGSAPQSPSGLTAEAQSPSQIDVRWVFNTGTELGFNIQRSETEGEWETIAGTAANVTVYHDDSAECEHTYSYRVLAYNDYGESAPSSAAAATADFCELDAPADLTAILDEEADDGSQRSILLSWSQGAGELPGVSASYEIYRKTFDASWSDTPLATQPSDQTTYTDEDAACGDTFQYRIRAANENDVKSAFSNVSTSRADACPLIDPSNLTATTDQAGSIELTWDINDPDATGYLLQRREHEARDEWRTIVDLPEGSTGYSDAGGECETTEYDYRLRAYNGDKQSAWIETLTPGSSFCAVDAPTGLYANAVGPNEIELSWINNADNATGIRIYRNEAELTTLSPDSTTYSDTTVDCQTLYRYTVTAFTANIESDFTNAEAAQSDYCPISAPFNVTTVGDGNEVTVSWEHNQQYVESFDVQRRVEGEGTWQLLETVAAPDTNVTDTTVACYRSYEYRVLAYNANVESAWSDIAMGAATGCTPVRPRPVMELLSPLSHLALSRDFLDDPPDPLYPLTLNGVGISADTHVLVGDLAIPCVSDALNCQVDETGNPDQVNGYCATSCTAALPDLVMKNAGTYMVRLSTPDPVFNGLNVSENTLTFSVVAPLPEITKIWPRGVMQLFNESGNPIPQEILVHVWAEKLMTNAQFRLGTNYAEIQEPGIIEDPETSEQEAWIKVSTRSLMPRDDAYDFSVINPSPGGGERIKPFGINPRVEDWADILATDLRSSRAAGPFPLIQHRISVPRNNLSTGLKWNAGAVMGGDMVWAAVRDANGRLLTRVNNQDATRAIPTPLSFTDKTWLDLQTRGAIGVSGFVSDRGPLYRGDGTFGERTALTMGNGPDSVFVSDVNGDGAPDLVTADRNSDTVSIRLGNGDGTFGERTALPMGRSPFSVFVSDLSGDGAPDLLTANSESDDVSIRLGTGDGTFGAITALSMGDGPQSVFVSDVNGDGAPDLITADLYSDTVSIRLGNGDRTFGERTALPMGDNPISVFVSDVNGDGAPDLLTADSGTYPEYLGTASIRLGVGDGTFGERTALPMGRSPFSVFVTDLSGDGAPDLVTADLYSDTVSIRLGNGDGSFGERAVLTMGDGPESVFVSDVNSDGAPDLVTADDYGNTVSIRLGNGDGSFGERTALPMGSGPESVFVSDVSGDGAPDLVTADKDGDTVSIRLGNGDGTFGERTALLMGDHPYSVFVSDLSGDGAPDLVTADSGTNPEYLGTASIRLGVGDGTFGERTALPMGRYPSSVFVSDVNGDGAPDLVTADYFDSTVSIRLGNGDGTFGERTALPMGDGPWSVFVSDLSGDGAPDLVTADAGSYTVSIRLGNGDGTFGERIAFPMGDGPFSVFVSDLSGDGAPDLVTADSYSDTVSIRLGNGDGSFGERTALPMGDGPESVFVSDVSGDGAPDLVTANYSSDTVSIRLGNGDGTFGERTALPMGDGPCSVFVSDVSGDGAPDIVTADRDSDTVSLRYLGIPGDWHQELTDSFSDDPDQPWLPKYAEVGFTDLDIHQAAQTITKVGVRVLLEWTTQPADSVDLGLTAPDGQMVDLGNHSDFTPWPDAVTPTSWRLNKTFRGYDFNEETGIAGLIDLHGLQPTDYWTLSIDNQTGASAEVKNFTVLTDGHF